jgi:hypothetical protein
LRPRGAAAARGRFTVWTDAILSPDLGALDAYSLAHCYAFHGFDVKADLHADLGNGVVGRLFVYQTREAVWHAVAWEWPVLRRGRVDHERIVLLASSTARPSAAAVARPPWVRRHVLGYLNARAHDDDPNTALSRAMVALAAQMISVRVSHA